MLFEVHAADISNPTKPTPLSAKWADLVMNEYFWQGDQERELGLKISNLCDRTTVEIPTAQLGFINFVVRPCTLLSNWKSNIYLHLSFFIVE